MTEINEIYKCNICGNIVELIHSGAGTLVCCGEAMILQKENSVDASKEKHVPVKEEIANGIKIKVGSIEHPMLLEHYIEFIEIITEEKVDKKILKPGQKPDAEFNIKPKRVTARAFCNVHGLWKN